MYLKIISYTIILLLLFSQKGCINYRENRPVDPGKQAIHVFAAAGTRHVSDQISEIFEKTNKYQLKYSYASSGTLARQISQGAEADIFISANRQWIDFLTGENLIQSESITKIGENSLVLVTASAMNISAPVFNKDFPVEASIDRGIAMGDPAYVPVGRYSGQALDALGWHDGLRDKIILAKDVSMALKYAEMGACDWAMVYHSEALLSQKVKIIGTVPDTLHEPIGFYIALSTGAKKEATKLLELYGSETGQKILTSAGFRTKKPSQ